MTRRDEDGWKVREPGYWLRKRWWFVEWQHGGHRLERYTFVWVPGHCFLFNRKRPKRWDRQRTKRERFHHFTIRW